MKPVSITPLFIQERKSRADMFDYPVPKWVEFSEKMLQAGYAVEYYEAQTTVSKYVTVSQGGRRFRVRFSNHKPNRYREVNGDCDFFVGVTHLGVTRTDDAIRAVHAYFK